MPFLTCELFFVRISHGLRDELDLDSVQSLCLLCTRVVTILRVPVSLIGNCSCNHAFSLWNVRVCTGKNWRQAGACTIAGAIEHFSCHSFGSVWNNVLSFLSRRGWTKLGRTTCVLLCFICDEVAWKNLGARRRESVWRSFAACLVWTFFGNIFCCGVVTQESVSSSRRLGTRKFPRSAAKCLRFDTYLRRVQTPFFECDSYDWKQVGFLFASCTWSSWTGWGRWVTVVHVKSSTSKHHSSSFRLPLVVDSNAPNFVGFFCQAVARRCWCLTSEKFWRALSKFVTIVQKSNTLFYPLCRISCE